MAAVAGAYGRARPRPDDAGTRVPDRAGGLALRAPALSADPRPAVLATRVAFLLDSLEGGGVQRMTLALARELAARGHAVDLLVCRPEGSLLGAVPDGVRLVLLPAAAAARAPAAAARDAAGNLLGPALPVLLARPHWTLRHLSALLATSPASGRRRFSRRRRA